MKALTWMRKLAATTALLALTLALVAPIAEANVPRRPIDRPEGPPEPNPTEVGDPDDGAGLLVAVWTPWGNQVVILRQGVIRYVIALFGVETWESTRGARAQRGSHAR